MACVSVFRYQIKIFFKKDYNINKSLPQKGVVPPPSLKNMFKELQNDIAGFEVPKHGDLTGWAKQGVHSSF